MYGPHDVVVDDDSHVHDIYRDNKAADQVEIIVVDHPPESIQMQATTAHKTL